MSARRGTVCVQSVSCNDTLYRDCGALSMDPRDILAGKHRVNPARRLPAFVDTYNRFPSTPTEPGRIPSGLVRNPRALHARRYLALPVGARLVGVGGRQDRVF